MNSYDELRARVKREPNRLVVNIEEEDQAKAGIASLECEFVVDSDDSESLADGPIDDSFSEERRHPSRKLEKLKKELKRTEELLEVTEKRLHNLRLKKQEHGAAALSAEEAAELRKKEKEVRQLEEEIHRLETQIREESVLSSDDSRPYLKVLKETL